MKDISISATRTVTGHMPGRIHVTKADRRLQALTFIADREATSRLVPLLDEDWDGQATDIELYLGGYYGRQLHLNS